MKPPIIDKEFRTEFEERAEFLLAVLTIKRNIGILIKPIVEWLSSQLKK